MIRGYTKCEIGEFFISDQGCKGTQGHGAKLYKVRSNKEVMKHFFHAGLLERWNNLEQPVVDALNIISFRNKLKQFEKLGSVFYGSPLNPTNLTCGLITVEASPGKEPGKETLCCMFKTAVYNITTLVAKLGVNYLNWVMGPLILVICCIYTHSIYCSWPPWFSVCYLTFLGHRLFLCVPFFSWTAPFFHVLFNFLSTVLYFHSLLNFLMGRPVIPCATQLLCGPLCIFMHHIFYGSPWLPWFTCFSGPPCISVLF